MSKIRLLTLATMARGQSSSQLSFGIGGRWGMCERYCTGIVGRMLNIHRRDERNQCLKHPPRLLHIIIIAESTMCVAVPVGILGNWGKLLGAKETSALRSCQAIEKACQRSELPLDDIAKRIQDFPAPVQGLGLLCSGLKRLAVRSWGQL